MYFQWFYEWDINMLLELLDYSYDIHCHLISDIRQAPSPALLMKIMLSIPSFYIFYFNYGFE